MLLLNKPVGPTSFQMVSRVRRLFGVKKAGHCGTLDPFASGVLPVCVGKATRVVRYMDGYDKEYRCTVKFGSFTDTQDREGVCIGGREPTNEEIKALATVQYQPIRDLITSLKGDLDQTPPMYSAVKIDGRPLYEYARKGIILERTARHIHISSSTVHEISGEDGLTADFTVSCSKGTYIRTLCELLGEQSGFGAHAQSLCRTRCGPFVLAQSFTLEDLEEMKEKGNLADALLPEDTALEFLRRVDLSAEEAIDIRLGRQLDFSIFSERVMNSAAGNNDDQRICVYYERLPVAVVFEDQKEGRSILRIERVFA